MLTSLRVLAQLSISPVAEGAQREFIFASPQWLWGLLILLPLLLLRRRQGSYAALTHPAIRLLRASLQPPSNAWSRLGPLLLTLGLASLIVALAEPKFRSELTEEKVSGIDIMIACDLSGSMNIRDMSFVFQDQRGRMRQRVVDRLSVAKTVIAEFIKGRPNDRMGIVAFAGKARLSCPLTLDHGLLTYIIEQFYLGDETRGIPGYIKEPGTAIGSAIASAATRLEERKDTKSKVIILVTDGQSNRGIIEPIEAAKQAAALGIRIFPIAIGQEGQLSANIMTDGVDEKTLRSIASLTKGKYFRANSGQQLARAFADIDSLEKSDATRRTVVSFESLYMYPVGLAALLLTASLLLARLRPQPAP